MRAVLSAMLHECEDSFDTQPTDVLVDELDVVEVFEWIDLFGVCGAK